MRTKFHADCESLEIRRLLAFTPYRWAGEVDPTVANISGGQTDDWSDIEVTADQKTVVVGTSSLDTRVLRYNRDGTLDPTLAGDGIAEFNFAPNEALSRVLALPDGKILLAGTGRDIPGLGVTTAAVIARLNPNGTLDSTFGGGDGVGVYNFSNRWASVWGMGLQSNNKILVLARSGLLARLNADGTPDTAFANSAVLETFDLNSGWIAAGLSIQADDRFLVAGLWPLPGNVGSVGRVARFMPDGARDLSFGNGGFLDIDATPGNWDEVSALTLRPNGTILLAIAAEYVENSDSLKRAELRQLLPNGSPDLAFGNGSSIDITHHTDEAVDLQVDSVGRIVGSGSRGTFRLTPTGQDDASYGIDGHDIIAEVKSHFTLDANNDVVGLGPASDSPRVHRLLGEARGDGPVFMDTQTSTLRVTGTPVDDQVSVTTGAGNVQLSFNGTTTEFPLSPGLSINIDTRGGIDHIIYDVGDAFAGVTNTVDGGLINYEGSSQIGRNRIEVRSGPIDGSLLLKRDAIVYNYFSDIEVAADATLDLTCQEGVILFGADSANEFDVSNTLSSGMGSVIRGPVRQILAGGGDDVVRGGTGTTVIGGAGDDSVLLINSGSATLDGGEGNDHIRMVRTDPSINSAGTLFDTRLNIGGLTGSFTATTELVSFQGSSAVETLSVHSLAPTARAEIDLGNGDDRLMFGSTSFGSQGSLQKLLGAVSAELGAGNDFVGFNDLLSNRPARAHVSESGIVDLDGNLFGSPTAAISFRGAENFLGTLSPLADDVTVTMSAQMRYTLTGGNPATAPAVADRLRLSEPDSSLALIDLSGQAAGAIRRDGRQPIDFSGIERWPIVGGNPDIPQTAFDIDGPHLLATFRPDVSASIGAPDVSVRNLRTGTTLAIAASAVTYDPTTRQLQVRFAAEDGDYRLWIDNQGILDPSTNQPLVGDGVLEFFVLAGDANRDRVINADDFAILAATFNAPGTFSHGDFNYDGIVNVGDFSILASKFNTTLPPAFGPAVRMSAVGSTRTPLRHTTPSDDVLLDHVLPCEVTTRWEITR